MITISFPSCSPAANCGIAVNSINCRPTSWLINGRFKANPPGESPELPRIVLKPQFFVSAELPVRPPEASAWERPDRRTVVLVLILTYLCLGWSAPPPAYAD